MKMLLIIFFILLTSSYWNWDGFSGVTEYKPDQSIGVLYLDQQKYSLSERSHFPEQARINLYDRPNGKIFGSWYLDADSKKVIVRWNEKPVKLLKKEVLMISHEGWAFQFYEERGAYLKVLVPSLKNGAWVRISDLNSAGLHHSDWMSFLITGSRLNYPRFSLNLRDKPEKSSKLLCTLKKEGYLIQYTGKHMGLWVEVIVEEYSKGESVCDGDEPIHIWKGWIKLIDDEGWPNVWFYPMGC